MAKQASSVTMATTVAVIAVLGFAFGPAPAAHAQAPTAIRAATVQRTTLVVGDIDKAIDFYQRLGLVKTSDTSAIDTGQGGVFGAADLPLTADSKSSRLAILKGGDAALLVLVWYDRPQLPSARGNLVGIGIGDVIVSIEAPDIQAAYGKLSQIGTRFQRTPVRFTQTNADGTGQTGQHFLAYDPDGHMVEVTQMDRR